MKKPRCLITGVTSGIGHATAELLLKKGYDVLGCGRRKTCDIQGIRYSSVDVTDLKALRGWVQSESTWLEGLDVLVNNAGLALGLKKFHEQSPEEIDTVLTTNVHALFELTRLTIPFMIKKGGGHIVNLGSIAGDEAYENGALYCATKAAVHAFSKALKKDLAGSGIRVSNIAPGKVRTDFSKVRFYGDESKASKAYEGYRPLEARDIADIILWTLDRPAHVEITNLTVLATDQIDAVRVV